MRPCAYCGKCEDYTDQFAVQLSEHVRGAACLSCFKRLRNGEKLETKNPIYYQKLLFTN